MGTYGDMGRGSNLIKTSPKYKTSLIKTYFFCHPQPIFLNV